jgi:enterobactin synthetase component D
MTQTQNQTNEISKPFFTHCHQVVLPHFSKLIIVCCEYDIRFYSKMLFKEHGVVYPQSLERAISKRKAEYLAGRYSAMQALDKLGARVTNITTGHHRNPIWPPNIIGSITHTTSTAFSALAYKTDFDHIGIDYEQIIEHSVAKDIASTIINDFEEQQLINWPMSFEKALTLVFSAKESLFKALYPKVGHYFDFSSAEILTISEEKNSFTIRLSQSLTQSLPKGMHFSGYFQATDQHILTVIAGSDLTPSSKIS